METTAETTIATNKNSPVTGAIAVIMSDIVLIDLLFIFIGLNHYNDTSGVGFFPLSTMAVLTFVLYRIFLRKQRTVPQAATFLIASYIITVFVVLTFSGGQSSLALTLLAILTCSVPQWRIFFMTEDPPTVEKLIGRVGAMTFSLLFVMITVVGVGNPSTVMFPSIISLAVCMIALVIARTAGASADTSRGFRGIAFILAFLLLVSAITGVFLLFISVAFGATIATGAVAIWSGIVAIANLFGGFIIWIASFFPMPDLDGEILAEPLHGVTDMAVELGPLYDLREAAVVIGLVVIIIAIVAFAIIMAIRLRNKKIGISRVKKVETESRSKLNLKFIIISRFVNALKFFITSIIYRNTPQGVFLSLERWGKLRRRGRRVGETPRSYLMRLAKDAPEHRELFVSLADALDESWYAETKPQKIKGKFGKLRRVLI